MVGAVALNLLVLIFLNCSWARVFDMSRENFATYLKGTWGTNSLKQKAFDANGPSSLKYDQSVRSQHSGEFGVVAVGNRASWKMAIEVLRPETLKTVSMTDATGAQLSDMSSEITVVIPKVGVDLNFKTYSLTRIYGFFSAGYGNLSIRNDYRFTTAGAALFGLADFSEDLKSTALTYDGGVAFERFLSDTTTFNIELGYRQINFTQLKFTKDVINFSGSQAKNAAATDYAGNARKLSLSGPFIGLTFRIYL